MITLENRKKTDNAVFLTDKLKALTEKNWQQLHSFQANKMDRQELEPFILKCKEIMRTIELANSDNFAQLMATDNYIEKYLPFTIQDMMAANLKPIIEQLDKSLPSEVGSNVGLSIFEQVFIKT